MTRLAIAIKPKSPGVSRRARIRVTKKDKRLLAIMAKATQNAPLMVLVFSDKFSFSSSYVAKLAEMSFYHDHNFLTKVLCETSRRRASLCRPWTGWAKIASPMNAPDRPLQGNCC